MPDSSHSSVTRRGFVATLGAITLAGCSSITPPEAKYQIVGGVERKHIRGIRDGTNRMVAETVPVNSSVVDSAPTDLAMRTVAYDTSVIDLAGEGLMKLDTTTIERIRDGYDDPYGVIVLTLYNDDPHNGVPKGNSYGYRVSLEQLTQVSPGDRVSAIVDTTQDIVAIDELLTVDSVGQ